MANIDAELEQQFKEAGKRLSCPLDSIDELLFVLDQIEKPLSRVDQSPKKSMLDALKPLMNALVQESLLKHSDIDVKVAVASCVSQITRITAPDLPYDDDQMRDIFQLIISSFEGIADQSSRSYIKRMSILETVFKVRLCVIMLDLECDALFVEMFEHFLRSVRDYHHESIYPSMESIMVLVLEESEEIPVEMLKPLLTSLKKDSEGVLPVARKLAEGVLLKSADKLKPYLMPAMVSLGDTLDKYTKVVASVCEGKTATVEHNDEIAFGVQQANERKLEKESVDEAQQADESNLTTTSPDRTGQVFKEEACPEEVDSTFNRPLKSVMINGVDVTGNQEASLDLEPSKKSEKEVIYQESLDKKDTDGTNKDKESKPEDQVSKKRGKEDDTVINSTESMVGLAHKRASRETSDASAKKRRVSRVAGDSSLVPPPVTCSTDATVERVRQMGPSDVVDRLTGMAKESAALFSHAAESIRALELDNSELKRQLNELVLCDKGYYGKISVLEGEIADLKSLHDQMKLTCEVRVVDADRRATEAERRFAEAKREMELENFKLKKQLDEHVLCDQGYEEKIRILGKRLAEAKRKMAGAEGSMKAALASLAL